MTREELISSQEFLVAGIQMDLFNLIENYMKIKGLNRTELAAALKVSKGYISQVLNGDFDHKLSKLTELSLSCDTIPLLFFVDKESYLQNDAKDKVYQLVAVDRLHTQASEKNKKNTEQKFTPKRFPQKRKKSEGLLKLIK